MTASAPAATAPAATSLAVPATVIASLLAGLPVIEFDHVWHVGTLDVLDRQDWSYEGDGLSVSRHPDEWASIARLGGRTWEIAHRDATPLRFVSWLDMDETARGEARALGVTLGWVHPQQVWRVSWFDDERDDNVCAEFDDEPQARIEADGLEDATVAEVTVWRATDSFPDDRVTRSWDPTDLLIAALIRATEAVTLDGVWWDETYDPERLSCPRGVIPHEVDRYAVRRAF